MALVTWDRRVGLPRRRVGTVVVIINGCCPGIVGVDAYHRAMYCRTCRGPVQAGFARCYQCDLAHARCGGLLAGVVAPVAYAVKGGRLAGDLWRYKSGAAGAIEAGARLAAMLARFVGEHSD